MSGAGTPNARPLVEVTPEQLVFRLIPNSQPGCPLTVRNSSNVIIAFKVKTTEPKRYLVRPNQGLVSGGGTEAVNVFLIEKECNELLQTLPADGRTGDKFLVQTVAVGDAYYAKHSSLNPTRQAEELTSLWAKADRSSVRNKKLAVQFVLPPPGAPQAESRSPTTPRTPVKRSAYGVSPVSQASPNVGRRYGNNGSDGGRSEAARQPSTLDEDSRELVSKYDDLVNYTANLTEERDELNQSLEEAKKALQREMATRIALESKGHLQQGRQGPSRGTSGSRAQANSNQRPAGGFGWFTLTLVAVVFFLLGRWLDFAGASDQKAKLKSAVRTDIDRADMSDFRAASRTPGEGGGAVFDT